MGLPGQPGGYGTRLGLMSLAGAPSVGDLIEMSPGLVSHFRFDETSGSVSHDFRGANDGTITGTPTFVPFNVPDPGAIELPTSSVHIRTANTINVATGGVEIWFRLLSLPTGTNKGLICGFYDSSSKTDKVLYVDASGFLHWLVNDGAAKTITSSVALVAGRMYQVAGLADGTHSTLVIDGVQDGQIAAGSTIASYTGTGNFYIGGGTADTYVAQPGVYDEGAIFSTAPTVAAINQRWLTGLQNITQSNARVSGYVVEALRNSSAVNARVSGYVVEAAHVSSARNARFSEYVVEVLRTTANTGTDFDVSADNGLTVGSSPAAARGVSGSATSSITLAYAASDSVFKFYELSASSGLLVSAEAVNPKTFDASATSGLTLDSAGSESAGMFCVASNGLSIFASCSDTEVPGHLVSAASSFSLTGSEVAARDGLVSASNGINLTYAAFSAGDRAVSASSSVTLDQSVGHFDQFSLFVAGESSLTVSQMGAKMGDFNLSAANMVYLTAPGRTYVSPILLAATTGIILSSSGDQDSLEILSVSASSGIRVGSSPSENRDAATPASSSLTATSAAKTSRAIFVSATTGLMLTPGDGSNGFVPLAGDSSVTLSGLAALELSATLASSGLVFTDLALAVVWLPWRPKGISLPAGGGLPHS